MKYIRAFIAVLAICGVQVGFSSEFQEKWGPDVGSSLPALSVKDIQGENRYLADLAGKKGVVLVFVRSSDW